MRRGTVLEADGGFAVVLTPDGEFVRVRAGGDIAVGQEIVWSDADRIPPARKAGAWRSKRRIAAVSSAAALFILLFALWSFRPPAVVAYVSMDINPSIEMGLDAKERVLKLRAINPDADELVKGMTYRGKPVEEVAREIAEKLEKSHILGGNGAEIVIASVRMRSVDEQWETRVIGKIEQVLQQAEADTGSAAAADSLTIETVFLPAEVREEAKQNGVSAGKMAFWLAAENGGHDVSLTDLKEKSLGSIASSWGGLKQVLDDGEIDKTDQAAWKKLLKEQKDKKKNEAPDSSSVPGKHPGNNGKPENNGKGADKSSGKTGPDKPNSDPRSSGGPDRPAPGFPNGSGSGNGSHVQQSRERGQDSDLVPASEFGRAGRPGKGKEPDRDRKEDRRHGTGQTGEDDAGRTEHHGPHTERDEKWDRGRKTDNGAHSDPGKNANKSSRPDQDRNADPRSERGKG